MKINIENIIKDRTCQMISKRYATYGFVTELDIQENEKIQVKSIVDVLSKQYECKLEFDHDLNMNHSLCTCLNKNCEHIGATLEVMKTVDHIPYHYSFDVKNKINEERQKAHTRRENAKLIELTSVSRNLLESRKNEYQSNIERIITKERYEIEPTLIEEYDEYRLSYKVGNEKKYVIKNLSQFLKMLENKEFHRYGKQLEMTHQVESFDIFSQKQIQLIKDIEKIQPVNPYTNTTSELTRFIDIDSENIDMIYETYQSNEGSNFRFITEEKKITLRWIEKEKYDELESITDLSEYLFGKKHLYSFIKRKNNYFIQQIQLDDNGYAISLLYELSKGSIKIMKDNRDEFYKYVLSDLFDYFDILHLPSFKLNQVEKIKVFGDIDQDGEVCFRIDYIDINQRRTPGFEENAVLTYKQDLVESYIRKYAMKVENHLAIFDSNSEQTLDFIENGLPFLQEYSEVYITETLKKLNERRNYHISVGVKYESDLLNLEIQSDELPKDELADILSQYRKKKKFYRLKSGELIHLNSSSIEELSDLLDDYHLDLKDFEDGNIQLDPYRMFSIEDDANNLEYIQFDRKQSFKDVLKKFDIKSMDQITIPEKYEHILRDYQKDGVKWLKLLRDYHFNGILADDMGLGKTLQVLALVDDIKSDLPTLVVAPSSLVYNWLDEVSKFSSQLNAVCVVGNQENRKKILESDANLFITSYDYIRRDTTLYEEKEFEYVILDEAQYIKNQKTQNAISVKKLKAKHKLALTGTPIENSLAELWSIFDFLMPNYLFNYHYFLNHFENDIVRNDDEDKKNKLKQLVSPFILRRNKKDVLTELPDKIEKTYSIEFNEEENQMYLAHLAQVNEELGKMMGNNKMDKIAILAMMTKLRQICCEPRLLFDNIYHNSSKMNACMELVRTLKENNQRVLIFSSFTSLLSLIEEELNALDISYFKLTGQTSKEERRELVTRFQNGEKEVFLISLKAGGTGLNLTGAQAVIHYDPWWNISAQNQATDRTYRIGQQKNVQVFKLVMKNSIEEKIMKLQEKKKDLADTFVEGNEGSISKMDKKDIMDLFKI